MLVGYKNGRFIADCRFEEKEIPRSAGFRWDSENKFWFTQSVAVAARLKDYFTDTARKKLRNELLVEDLWAGGSLSVPDGLELYNFQKQAVEYALRRNRCYLGLDPGLGKTPIAAVICATLAQKALHGVNVIYICPPFLTRNTENEFKKWAPKFRVQRYEVGSTKTFHAGVLIVPDSMLIKDITREELYLFKQISKRENAELVLLVDEAHRFKNQDAGRTKSLLGGNKTNLGLISDCDRIIYMSGTPMPGGRPMELFSILSKSANETIDGMNKFEFGVHYCGGFQTQWGWDFTGATNVSELRERVQPKFMLRMKKQDVMNELPEKLEHIILLSKDAPPKYAKLSQAVLRKYSPVDLVKAQIESTLLLEDEEGNEKPLHIATYRRELGILKVKPAIEYIKNLLEDSDEAVLIFAIHKDVITQLSSHLLDYFPQVITGETPMKDRDERVREFQNPKSKSRVFIGNIQAAGIGLTLTRASRVIFVESSWTPSDNEQASDRAHRIGQTETVLVQHLVFENSLDRAVLEVVLNKRDVNKEFDK